MKRIVRITETDLTRIVKKVISEEEKTKESMVQKLMRKLKGVDDKQLEYNIKNDLPWDWRGSKEGYYDKIEGRKNYGGSN
jgi:hypothetical protein